MVQNCFKDKIGEFLMNILVTGGTGFIGRWVVKKFLDKEHNVWIIDNLENSSEENIADFKDRENLKQVMIASVTDSQALVELFKIKFDIILHLAAQISVQESLDNPNKAFNSNIVGTYKVLKHALKQKSKIVLMGTCMVYDLSTNEPINEEHPVKPLSPYAASKLAAENIAESFYYAYKLPVVIVRPFNTYGPFQKTNMEGGVVSIFINQHLKKQTLNIYGDGIQTRDLLYVEDCADFIYQAATNEGAVGHIINAGTGRDISINELAKSIEQNTEMIKHVPHIHPNAEIPKLLCNSIKANQLLGWYPKVSLEQGIEKTKQWLMKQ